MSFSPLSPLFKIELQNENGEWIHAAYANNVSGFTELALLYFDKKIRIYVNGTLQQEAEGNITDFTVN